MAWDINHGATTWKNDQIAYRLYGPALEKHELSGSGVDVWVKKPEQEWENYLKSFDSQ